MNRKLCIIVSVPSAILACALALNNPATAVTPDQGTNFKGDGSYSGISSTQSMAQIFIPSQSGSLTQVGLGIGKSGTVTNLTIGISPASGGIPTGSSLATTTLTGSALSVVTAGQTVFNVTFTSPALVTAGTPYAIVATSTDNYFFLPFFGGGIFAWYYSNAYANGNAASKSGATWNALSSDFTFAAYVDATGGGTSESAPAPFVPQALVQEFGKTASSTCDVAAPETLNWSGVASGGWGESWAQWVNSGRGGAVCTRMLVYSTAQSRWVVG